LHSVYFLVTEENYVGIQVGVDNILLVDELKEIDKLQTDIYRLYFCEESGQAFRCPK